MNKLLLPCFLTILLVNVPCFSTIKEDIETTRLLECQKSLKDLRDEQRKIQLDIYVFTEKFQNHTEIKEIQAKLQSALDALTIKIEKFEKASEETLSDTPSNLKMRELRRQKVIEKMNKKG